MAKQRKVYRYKVSANKFHLKEMTRYEGSQIENLGTPECPIRWLNSGETELIEAYTLFVGTIIVSQRPAVVARWNRFGIQVEEL